MSQRIVNHEDLGVYQRAFGAAMEIFRLSKSFPKEEQYALTDQIRRASRSVCANLAEAWRRRRYEQAFINCLSIAEGEAAETQVWLQFAVGCNYLKPQDTKELHTIYAGVLATLVGMINHPETWVITNNHLREAPEPYSVIEDDRMMG